VGRKSLPWQHNSPLIVSRSLWILLQ